MIGSKRKVIGILKKMAEKGLNRQDHIYTPIGLKLGGDTAEEIALAIAAEILGLHHQAPGLNHCRIKAHSSPMEW
jgi:xanthine dehydrogenase accessory factor